MKNLCEIPEGETKRIAKILGSQIAIKRRLLELGFLPGRKVKIAKKSLSKKTVLVQIEEYLLAIRCSIAKAIIVE